jgi:hypothetical protein
VEWSSFKDSTAIKENMAAATAVALCAAHQEMSDSHFGEALVLSNEADWAGAIPQDNGGCFLLIPVEQIVRKKRKKKESSSPSFDTSNPITGWMPYKDNPDEETFGSDKDSDGNFVEDQSEDQGTEAGSENPVGNDDEDDAKLDAKLEQESNKKKKRSRRRVDSFRMTHRHRIDEQSDDSESDDSEFED